MNSVSGEVKDLKQESGWSCHAQPPECQWNRGEGWERWLREEGAGGVRYRVLWRSSWQGMTGYRAVGARGRTGISFSLLLLGIQEAFQVALPADRRQTGDRQETDTRQVKWSHHAKKHGHRKNPNLIHWTYPCVYTTRALIRLKIGFTGKRLWKDIDILGLSRFTHGPKWSGKDAEQAKFFLNHVDILLLVMTAIAWICSFFRLGILLSVYSDADHFDYLWSRPWKLKLAVKQLGMLNWGELGDCSCLWQCGL